MLTDKKKINEFKIYNLHWTLILNDNSGCVSDFIIYIHIHYKTHFTFITSFITTLITLININYNNHYLSYPFLLKSIMIFRKHIYYEIYFIYHIHCIIPSTYPSLNKNFNFFKLVYFRPLISLRKSSVLEISLWISYFKNTNSNVLRF